MSEIKLTADSGGGTTSIKAPSSTTSNADVVLKLPVADGSSGEVLKTDGSGQLSFTSNAGTTINNNADNRVITGSGTANTLEGESSLTYTGSVLNVNSPSIGTDAKLIVKGNDTNNHDIITAYANTSTRGSFAIRTGTSISPSFLVGTRGGSETFALMTNGTERLRVTDNGLTFNGDTAAANALDDYEEGTWTPYFFCTNNSQTVSYASSAHAGHYTKIGNKVFATFRMFWSSKSGNGNFNVGNLPFTSSSDTNISQPSGFTSHYFSGMGSNNITGYLLNNSTQVRIGYHSNGGFINQNFSNLSSSGEYNGHITYYVN